MTSNEIHEQITAYVGERVDEQEYRAKARGAAKPCPDCGENYQRELATRTVVRTGPAADPEPPAPAGALPDRAALNGTTANGAAAPAAKEPETAPQPAPARDEGPGFLASPINIIIGLIIVVASAWAVFGSSGTGEGKIIVEDVKPKAGSGGAASAAPENLFNKAGDNFAAVMAGTLTAQHATSDPAELARYFKENGVAYNVSFAPVRATLVGGVISQHGSTRLAHILFSKGDATIYLFEVPNDILRKGNIVTVSDEVLKQLDAGQTLWEQPGGHSLAMFRKGDLVYVAVANLWKEELFPLISTK